MLDRIRSIGPWMALLLIGLAAFGCRSDEAPTSIKTLLDDPGRFDGKNVTIVGDVSKAYSVMNYGVYQVEDGTGSLGVVASESGSPRVGARVGVTGVFHSAFTLGTETAAILKEGKRFTPPAVKP